MATVRPFQAVRPKAGLEEEIAALPYDVYNRAEASSYVKDHPDSFLAIDRAETSFPLTVDTYDDRVYEKARDLYREKVGRGDLVKDPAACFYLYEQTMDGRSQTGLVCTASVEEYCNGTVKKHENTRREKEEDRVRHVDTLKAQTGPIFLTHRSDERLIKIYERIKKEAPYCSFELAGVFQRCWKIAEEETIKDIVDIFAGIPSLYIADGHHRCASAVRVSLKRREENKDPEAECNYFLSVVFPDTDLMIMDYNRVVKDLNGLTLEGFLEKISENFNVEAMEESEEKPKKKGEIFLYTKMGQYRIRLKEELLPQDPVGSLDVSVLQDFLLEPVLGIKDPKTDSRIDFVGGIRGVKELKRRVEEDAVIAFGMFPTSIDELLKVADAGLLMPPKSTWFEPKLLSGLFIHEI